MSKCAVAINIQIGHSARVLSRATSEGFTHEWTVFVRGHDDVPISGFVDKVVFSLHESFKKPKRVLKQPPYQLTERGYGGFNLPIEIFFRSGCEETRKTRFEYDLFLQDINGMPINHIRAERITFFVPEEDLKKKLLAAGGELIETEAGLTSPRSGLQGSSARGIRSATTSTSNSSSSSFVNGRSSSPGVKGRKVNSEEQFKGNADTGKKPAKAEKFSGINSAQNKQIMKKPSDFQAIFGDPIMTSQDNIKIITTKVTKEQSSSSNNKSIPKSKAKDEKDSKNRHHNDSKEKRDKTDDKNKSSKSSKHVAHKHHDNKDRSARSSSRSEGHHGHKHVSEHRDSGRSKDSASVREEKSETKKENKHCHRKDNNVDTSKEASKQDEKHSKSKEKDKRNPVVEAKQESALGDSRTSTNSSQSKEKRDKHKEKNKDKEKPKNARDENSVGKLQNERCSSNTDSVKETQKVGSSKRKHESQSGRSSHRSSNTPVASPVKETSHRPSKSPDVIVISGSPSEEQQKSGRKLPKVSPSKHNNGGQRSRAESATTTLKEASTYYQSKPNLAPPSQPSSMATSPGYKNLLPPPPPSARVAASPRTTTPSPRVSLPSASPRVPSPVVEASSPMKKHRNLPPDNRSSHSPRAVLPPSDSRTVHPTSESKRKPFRKRRSSSSSSSDSSHSSSTSKSKSPTASLKSSSSSSGSQSKSRSGTGSRSDSPSRSRSASSSLSPSPSRSSSTAPVVAASSPGARHMTLGKLIDECSSTSDSDELEMPTPPPNKKSKAEQKKSTKNVSPSKKEGVKSEPLKAVEVVKHDSSRKRTSKEKCSPTSVISDNPVIETERRSRTKKEETSFAYKETNELKNSVRVTNHEVPFNKQQNVNLYREDEHHNNAQQNDDDDVAEDEEQFEEGDEREDNEEEEVGDNDEGDDVEEEEEAEDEESSSDEDEESDREGLANGVSDDSDDDYNNFRFDDPYRNVYSEKDGLLRRADCLLNEAERQQYYEEGRAYFEVVADDSDEDEDSNYREYPDWYLNDKRCYYYLHRQNVAYLEILSRELQIVSLRLKHKQFYDPLYRVRMYLHKHNFFHKDEIVRWNKLDVRVLEKVKNIFRRYDVHLMD